MPAVGAVAPLQRGRILERQFREDGDAMVACLAMQDVMRIAQRRAARRPGTARSRTLVSCRQSTSGPTSRTSRSSPPSAQTHRVDVPGGDPQRQIRRVPAPGVLSRPVVGRDRPVQPCRPRLRSNPYPVGAEPMRLRVRQAGLLWRTLERDRPKSLRRPRSDLLVETAGEPVGRNLEVVAGLQVHPELRLHGEVAGETERRVGGHGAAAVHQIVDALRRHSAGLLPGCTG